MCENYKTKCKSKYRQALYCSGYSSLAIVIFYKDIANWAIKKMYGKFWDPGFLLLEWEVIYKRVSKRLESSSDNKLECGYQYKHRYVCICTYTYVYEYKHTYM